jgi:molecular chaperone GrpE
MNKKNKPSEKKLTHQEKTISQQNDVSNQKQEEETQNPISTKITSEDKDTQSVLLQQLNEALAKIDETQNRFLLASADLENYRKRVTREKEELSKYAVSSIIEELIPVLDNLSLGLLAAAEHPEAKPVAEGFIMVNSQLKSILAQNGLKEINPAKQTFDPNLHDCLSTQPHNEIKEDCVITVNRIGYMLHDRLLRPASVIVSSGPKNVSSDPQNDSQVTKEEKI